MLPYAARGQCCWTGTILQEKEKLRLTLTEIIRIRGTNQAVIEVKEIHQGPCKGS